MIQLGSGSLSAAELKQDKSRWKRFGPCAVGEKAVYLNSFFFERRYYVPFADVRRVYKRVAMSKGGFTGRGLFASIPYLVVEYDDGKEKQCNFKYEEQVDLLLDYLRKTRPGLPLLSAAGEERLRKKEAERAARRLPVLSPPAQKAVDALSEARGWLDGKAAQTVELSQAARRKRAFLQSNPSYRHAALAITLLGAAALCYGLVSLIRGSGSFAIYFTLFGLAAIFLFSGFSILPTAKNNRRAVMARADKAEAEMAACVRSWPGGRFPVLSHYAHPVVLTRMIRALEEGRAFSVPEALEEVKRELKALNASVEVDQEEYDEVVAIKAMFLNHDYE